MRRVGKTLLNGKIVEVYECERCKLRTVLKDTLKTHDCDKFLRLRLKGGQEKHLKT